MFAVEKALVPGHRSMNPCPIYDDFTGQIFLFFIAVQGRTTESYQIITGRNLARLCYVTSSDQGRTWSDVTDLTQKVIGESFFLVTMSTQRSNNSINDLRETQNDL